MTPRPSINRRQAKQADLALVDTPALLIEKSVMTENLKAMQSLADKYGVSLRPHIKTHKTPELARLQIDLGAAGIATAKLGEAETMARAGLRDIQIANIVVGSQKIDRLLRLSRRCRLSVAVDSAPNIRDLSDTFRGAGRCLVG